VSRGLTGVTFRAYRLRQCRPGLFSHLLSFFTSLFLLIHLHDPLWTNTIQSKIDIREGNCFHTNGLITRMSWCFAESRINSKNILIIHMHSGRASSASLFGNMQHFFEHTFGYSLK
jgi:hypothetical protein